MAHVCKIHDALHWPVLSPPHSACCASLPLLQGYLHHSAVQVDTLLIAPPNVGDATFAANFGKRVNARRIPFVSDLVPQIPCSPTMIACNGTVTANPKPWSYSPVPGTLLLQPSGMPQQADKWALFDKIYPCKVGEMLRATHICSYQCYMSQSVTDKNNLCQLWDVGSTPATGSYCFKFPFTSGTTIRAEVPL